MNDCIVEAGCSLDHCIIDKDCSFSAGTVLNGNEHLPLIVPKGSNI
jgi:ADP-glucose pyrophosphorylase